MKNITFLFLLICSSLFSQNILIQYETQTIANDENVEKLFEGSSGEKNDFKKQLINELTKKRLYHLYVIDSLSYFTEVPILDNFQTENTNIRFGENEDLFLVKDLEKQMLYEQVIIDKKYAVTDSLLHFNWEVDDSIKTTISDIRIQKAKALNPKDSTALTAWFTIDEMNFKHGPEKYWGLPGVILELKIEFWEEKSLFESFTFKATSIATIQERDKKRILRRVDLKNPITKEEYAEKLKAYEKRMTDYYDEGVSTN